MSVKMSVTLKKTDFIQVVVKEHKDEGKYSLFINFINLFMGY